MNRRFSNHWKKYRRIFQSLEKTPANFPIIGKNAAEFSNHWKKGAALIVALWVLIILSLLIGSFAFDMHIEAGITSYYRKRLKAQYLARGGVEYAKLLLQKSFKPSAFEGATEEEEAVRVQSINLSKGISVSGVSRELGAGKFTVDIVPEPGRRNINTLTDDDWDEIFDQGKIPESEWPTLRDCVYDWIDESDEHRLHGAESDDTFYTERGYEVKNAPMDSVDELLLIKGFTPEMVYGGKPMRKGDDPMPGIAHLLTVWGEGRVNVNTASREVLMTLPNVEPWMVDAILERRLGEDGEANTKDDGFESVDEAIKYSGLPGELAGRISVSDRKYVRISSIGEVQQVRSGVWCIYEVGDSTMRPVYWREENMK